MNANNEVTLHRSEILPQSEIEYPIKLQGSNNDKSTVETTIKNYEHHPSIKLIKEHIAGLRPVTLLKKRLWYRCFPVNFVKFLRTPFFTEQLWWLFLSVRPIYKKDDRNEIKIIDLSAVKSFII